MMTPSLNGQPHNRHSHPARLTPHSGTQASAPAHRTLRPRRFKRIVAAAVLTSTLATAFAFNAHAQGPLMGVPGAFDVSPAGAATYTIPIAVPPGSAGMAPTLALSYSSNSGNGLLGLGWYLSGLPTIERCPRTIAQDGAREPVHYDATDRYCMGGLRLVAVNGSYGADGTEYRTEIESFSKVIGHGTMNGHQWFQVWTKGGQILEYGHTADAKLMTQDNTAVRRWHLNRQSDHSGNYLTVTYHNAASDGFIRPTRIDYTGNTTTSLAPYNSVRFSYETRTDQLPRYHGGSHTQITHRLSAIDTYAGNELIRQYQLSYAADSGIRDSRLSSVALCDGASNCLPATTFTWPYQNDPVSFTPYTRAYDVDPFDSGTAIGDFNGDGIQDFLSLPATNASQWGLGYTDSEHSYGSPNDSHGYGAHDDKVQYSTDAVPSTYQGDTWYASTSYLHSAGDFNGDGYTDVTLSQVATYRNGTWITGYYGPVRSSVNLNDGGVLTVNQTGSWAPSDAFAFGDFNGDGQDDLLRPRPAPYETTPYYSNGDGTFTASTTPFSGLDTDSVVFPGNFDGSACTDILAQGTVNRLYFSCHANTAYVSIPDWSNNGYQLNLSDYNGDGLTDVLLTHTSNDSELWLATGTGFTQVWSGPTDWHQGELHTGDVNSDGRADLMIITPQIVNTVGEHKVYLSTGTGFVQGGAIAVDATGTSYTNYGARVVDFSNDGDGDLLIKYQLSSDYTFYRNNARPQRITSIDPGFGTQIQISYKRLNESVGSSPTYTRGTHAQSFSGPQAVVSRVRRQTGLSGFVNYDYHYEDARFDPDGRGLLGFRKQVMEDPVGITYTTTYHQDFPFAGQVSTQVQAYNGVQMQSITHYYTQQSLTGTGGDHRRIRLYQSNEVYKDLNGASLPGVTKQYSHDNYGNVTTVTETRANNVRTTTHTYQNDTTSWLIGLRTASSTLYTQTGLPSITRESAYQYDSTTGLLTQSQVEPNNTALRLTTDYTYDSYGNVLTTTVSGADIATATTTRSYDSEGRFLLSTTNAKSQSDSFTWDAGLGVRLSHTDPNGRISSTEYDGYGRVIQTIAPDGRQQAVFYQYCNGVLGGTALCGSTAYGKYRVLTRPLRANGTTASGMQTFTAYDSLGRPIAQASERHDGAWAMMETTYDGYGRPYRSTHHPYYYNIDTPEWVQRQYDRLHRVTRETYPDSSSTAYTYNGRTVSETNALNQTRTTLLDTRGQLFRVTEPGSLVTEYRYNAAGELIEVTDPAGNVTTQTYDTRGRVIQRDDPNLGTWHYQYTVLGQLKQQTDAKNQVSTVSYDALGRMTQQVTPDLTSTFVYDTASNGIGALHYMETSNGDRRTHAYNAHGRPNRTHIQIDGTTYTFQHTYNGDGKLNSLTYPSGYQARYVYGGNQRVLTALREYGTNTLLWNAPITDRDASGKPTYQRLGTAAEIHHSFDPDTHRLSTIQAGPYGGSTHNLANLSYQYDALGNLTQRYDANEVLTETFQYDALNRLTQMTTGTTIRTVAYDAVGNITQKRRLGSTATNTYSYPTPGQNQPNAVTSVSGLINGVTNPTFSYDDNGNLTSGAGRTLSWTSFDKVATLTENSTTLTYTYDAQQQRIKQSDGSNTILYLNDPVSGASAEYHTDNGGQWHDYLHADGQRIGIRKETLSPAEITFQFFIPDNQGSIVSILNEDGTLSERLSYDAWGMRRYPDGSEDTTNSISPALSRGYTDHEHLPNSRIINMNGRLYDPELGKHLSADPYIPNPYSSQGYNRYSYVYNNPLRYTDPSGYDACEESDGCYGGSGQLPVIDVRGRRGGGGGSDGAALIGGGQGGSGAFGRGGSSGGIGGSQEENNANEPETLGDTDDNQDGSDSLEETPKVDPTPEEPSEPPPPEYQTPKPEPTEGIDGLIITTLEDEEEKPGPFKRFVNWVFNSDQYTYESLNERFGNICQENCGQGTIDPGMTDLFTELTGGTVGTIGVGAARFGGNAGAPISGNTVRQMRNTTCTGILAACAFTAKPISVDPQNIQRQVIDGLHSIGRRYDDVQDIKRGINLNNSVNNSSYMIGN